MAVDLGAISLGWDAFKKMREMAGGEKLTQQTAGGIVPTLDDEAVLLAVDQAVSQLTDKPKDKNDEDDTSVPQNMRVSGQKVMRKIVALRSKRLKPHQNDRWRKIIATLELTEHFEQFATSVIEKIPTAGADVPQEGQPVIVPMASDSRKQAQQGQPKKKTGLHEIIRSYQRMPKDYEYTWEDPRVGHLVMVAGLIESDDPKYDPDKDVDDFKTAYEYLLSNCFDEKSIPETVIEKTKKLQEAITSGAYDALISMGLSDDLKAAEQLVAKDDPRRVALLNAAYEKALDDAITLKREQIESHRDGIRVWDGWKDKNGEDVVRIKHKWLPTYFSLNTWITIIITLVIFLVAGMNSRG